MKSSKLFLFILVSSILIAFRTAGLEATSADSASLIINNVDWTTTVEPGDTDSTLEISVSNLSNLTLSAITGTLVMSYPFSDHLDGDTNATAQGIASSAYINVSQYTVLSGEPFTLQFSLDIHPDAKIGAYPTDLEIAYHYVNSTGSWERDTGIFLVDLIIPNREPVIITSNPSSPFVSMYVDEQLEFSIQAIDPDNQSLAYKWLLDNIELSINSNYTFSATEDNLGYHILELIVRDPFNMTASTTWTVNVIRESSTTLNIKSNHMFAGYTSVIAFNLTNTVWKGTADITINVPDGIIITGLSSWKLIGLSPGDEVSLNTTLYAPLQLLGQVVGISLVISYTDYLGNDVVEDVIQGIIIRGSVNMVVYDLVTQFNPSNQKLTFNANLLNKGTVSALFVNVSLYQDPDLLLTLDSTSYIGELEENDPIPFTLSAYLNRDPVNGEIVMIHAVVSWTDDLKEELYKNITFILVIQLPTTITKTSGGDNFDLVIGSGFTLIVLVTAIVGFFYIRQRNR
ncbi:MAG: COG1361 S-layer family protein [Candidatus Odinarchaeota archaeon]